MDNSKLDGSPELDKISRATLQHRNTPDSEYGMSPAQLVYGRPMRDFLPIRPGDFSPSEVWIDCREKRELAMRKRLIKGSERWSEHAKDLPPLSPGSRVLIQNQHGAGKIANRWDKSGLVLEHLGFNKYRVKVDGSGRITDRNRQFLKKFTPVTPSLPGPKPTTSQVEPSTHSPTTSSHSYQHFDSVPTSQDVDQMPSSPIQPSPRLADNPETPSSPTFVTPPSSPVLNPNVPESAGVQPNLPETPNFPRRSTRVSRPPDRLKYDKF